MTYSQNGYPASSDKSAIGIVPAVVPGTNIAIAGGLKGGDVAFVLLWVASQFHQFVEKLDLGQKDDGGWNFRKIDGSNTYSNHASGTAMDLNWARHPMGAKGTFTTAQIAKIHQLIAFCEGVVRWGGDYSGRRDEMHFEIYRPLADVTRIAKKIRDSIAGTDGFLVEDGVLGSATIRRWQKVMKTPVDGVISHPSALVEAVQRRLQETVDSTLKVDGEGIVQNGKSYKTVGALQRYLKVPVDGSLSVPTSETVKALQRRLNENRF